MGVRQRAGSPRPPWSPHRLHRHPCPCPYHPYPCLCPCHPSCHPCHRLQRLLRHPQAAPAPRAAASAGGRLLVAPERTWCCAAAAARRRSSGPSRPAAPTPQSHTDSDPGRPPSWLLQRPAPQRQRLRRRRSFHLGHRRHLSPLQRRRQQQRQQQQRLLRRRLSRLPWGRFGYRTTARAVVRQCHEQR